MTETHLQCYDCAMDWAVRWMHLPWALTGSYILRNPKGIGMACCDTCDNLATTLIFLRTSYEFHGPSQ